MAGYTDYLNLYFKNPRTDGADTFNIQTMLNNNWEAIDAFAQVAGLPAAGNGYLLIRCLDSNNKPVSGCVAQTGDKLATSTARGFIRFLLQAGEYTVTVRSPIDYGLGEQTLTATVQDGQTTDTSVTVEDHAPAGNQIKITSSTVCAFSDRVTSADVFAVGGGGSGAVKIRGYKDSANDYVADATGGGGGYTNTEIGIDTIPTYTVTIGAGGDSVSQEMTTRDFSLSTYKSKSGNDGGETSVTTSYGTIISAPGGKRGTASTMWSSPGADGGSGSGAACRGINTASVGSSGVDGADGGDAYWGSTVDAAGGKGQGKTTHAFGETTGESGYSAAGASACAEFYDTSNTFSFVVGTCGDGAGTADAQHAEYSAASAEGSDAAFHGCGGGAAVGLLYSQGSSFTAKSGAGAPGIVIFRWEVAE